MLGLGSLLARYPKRVADFVEKRDAAGSKRRRHNVEASDWTVTLYRVLGFGMLLAGVAFSIGALGETF